MTCHSCHRVPQHGDVLIVYRVRGAGERVFCGRCEREWLVGKGKAGEV